jgi:SEC-C motif
MASDPLNRMTTKKHKLGRNKPCHCGSGKKFKKCHGAHSSSAMNGSFFSAPSQPSQVPPQVVDKAQRYLVEHQQREQERTNRFGHVRPEIAGDYKGHKFIAIGNQLMYMKSEKCRFFTDVLIARVPLVFGREWFDNEVAKPPDERHPVMQWRVKALKYVATLPQLRTAAMVVNYRLAQC